MSIVRYLTGELATNARVMNREPVNAGFAHRLPYRSIASVLSLLLMGQVLPARAQTTLATGQDVVADGLNLNQYNLLLGGDVTWNTGFTVNSAARSNIVIDGAGYTITGGPANNQRFLSFSQSGDVSITNATITSQPFTGAQSALFRLNTSNTTVNMNLGGTTFSSIGPSDFNSSGSADWGPIISVRGGSNIVLNIDGGAAGVTFRGNHGLNQQPGVIGLYGNNTINFTGKISFLDNWTGSYGGAVTIFESAGQEMTFAGETMFQNNHAAVFGGAIDLWGNRSALTFNGPVTFQGNYVYGTSTFSEDSPSHVTNQDSRGGAVHIGFISSTGADNVNVTTNGAALFDGNYVIETKNGFDAMGGALAAYSNGGNDNYLVNLNGPTTFSNNYVYSESGSGFGGAVHYDSGNNGAFTLGSGSSFLNNYAQTLGGAIYQESGNINLNANGGDIIFQGNRQAADFTATGNGFFTPVAGSGRPNAIYLSGDVPNSGILTMDAGAGSFIHFYDPIATRDGASATISKTGAGSVIFHGNSSSPGDPLYDSVVYVNTMVNGGTFALTDKVTYGVVTSGAFSVNDGGTVQGTDGSTLAAFRIAINSGGSIAASGGAFNLNAGNGGIISTAGRFTGFGSIVAPSISLGNSAANISTVDVAGGNTLTLDTVLTDAGGLNKTGGGNLILTGVNTYTGSTSITSGTLLVGDSPGTGAELAGGGEVLVGAGGALGGYGKVTGTVVNDGLVGVGNALPALAMTNRAAASFFAAGAAVVPVLAANNSSFTVVGDFDNRGVITMNNGVAGDQMIVTGTYTSDGGQLLIDTVLNEGGANALSDILVAGATSVGAGGATRITVNRVGGSGTPTQGDGIQVVFVNDPALSAPDAFVLGRRVVAGVYEYSLFMGGVNDPADGQWYLRTTQLGPRPEVVAYLANQHLAGAMFVHSVHDRLDDPGFVARQDFDAFDAPRDRTRSGWLRMSGDWGESRSANGDFKVDSNAFQMQGGIELAEWQGAGEEDDVKSSVHVGVMGSYGNASSRAKVIGNPAQARGEVEGWIAGVYGTWYQDDEKKSGAYVDTWFQYGWFSNRVKGDLLPTAKYRTQGWAVSGEAGYALPLGNDWVVEPQAQLLYANYRDGGLTEPGGTQVSWDASVGWTSRLGVRTYWTTVSEDSRKVQPYVTVNWWHAGEDAKIFFNQTPIGSPYASDRYELKLGVSGDLDQRWTGWASVSGAWDGHSSQQYVLRAGVKYTW